MNEILEINSITQFHQMIGIAPPEHPLISLIEEDQETVQKEGIDEKFFDYRFTSAMYAVMFKDGISGMIDYGRNSYDFQEGTMLFMSPGQVFAPPSPEQLEGSKKNKGWTLLFHPDLIQKSTLGEHIDHYTFFSYTANEALHISEKERKFIVEVVHQIKEEYSQNIDKHSQRLIISNLELLLNYCTRFYDRQFYTRSNFQ